MLKLKPLGMRTGDKADPNQRLFNFLVEPMRQTGPIESIHAINEFGRLVFRVSIRFRVSHQSLVHLFHYRIAHALARGSRKISIIP